MCFVIFQIYGCIFKYFFPSVIVARTVKTKVIANDSSIKIEEVENAGQKGIKNNKGLENNFIRIFHST